jgi:thiol-disulfide isomerase/thioredoxin
MRFFASVALFCTSFLLSFSASAQQSISFELIDEHNTFQSSTQWQGKPTFVFVWKSDCPACQQELPAIARFAAQATDVHLILISLSSWQETHTKLSLLPNSVIRLRSVHGESLLKRLGNRNGLVPYSLLLSSEHRLLQKHFGEITEQTLINWSNSLSSTH